MIKIYSMKNQAFDGIPSKKKAVLGMSQLKKQSVLNTE